MARANSGNFRAPRCRLAFSDGLFEARAFEGGKLKFGATFIFLKKDVKPLVDKLDEVGAREWGKEKYMQMIGPRSNLPLLTEKTRIKWPILDGNGIQARSRETGELHNGFGPDYVFIRASTSDDTVPVEMRAQDKFTPATKAQMYSGCYVLPVINVYAWVHPASGSGMSFGLSFIQKVGEGESLGGRAPVDPEKWYVEDAYEGEEETSGSVYD